MSRPLIQIHLKPKGYEVITKVSEVEQDFSLREHDEFQESLLKLCPKDWWPNDSNLLGCPRPVLVQPEHQRLVSELHDALMVAITDIVQRWFSDEEADFPGRMPIVPEEEELLKGVLEHRFCFPIPLSTKHADGSITRLKWVETQVSVGNIPAFSLRQGSWRPDFLVDNVTSAQDGQLVENFRITEINARFSFNGFMHEAYGQQALDGLNLEERGLVSATEGQKIYEGLLSMFNPNIPLHLLHGKELGIDIYMFIEAVHRQFGLRPRIVRPKDLRLAQDPLDPGSKPKLCCVLTPPTAVASAVPIRRTGEDDASQPSPSLSSSSASLSSLAQSAQSPLLSPTSSLASSVLRSANVFTTSTGELVEEITQIGLETRQVELLSLPQEILHAVALRCFNDMRTVFLVHDKRMLGIVKQEAPSLVQRGLITSAQAHILENGIADSILPGSAEMNAFAATCIDLPHFKNDFLLKPIRGGKGVGILFGEDLDAEEWRAAMARHTMAGIELDDTCVVQRRIRPRLYDLILRSSDALVRYPLVGTYHVVHGKFLGLGTWRSSADHICAVTSGGAWICSVMHKNRL